MLSEERYARILENLAVNGSVTVAEIAETFKVSAETVRRDLIYLEAQGRLKRVFGGAIANESAVRFEDFPLRLKTHREQKVEVAYNISSFICEGDIIALDAGTTAVEVAEVLKEKFKRLTVLTYSLSVFEALKDCFNVVLSGGEYYPKEEALYGELATANIGMLHSNKCFIFPSAVSVEYGVEDYVPCFIPVQREIIRNSDHVYIAADSSKFDSRAFIKLCDVQPEFVYITDGGISAETEKKFTDNSLSLFKGGINRE